MLLIDIMADNCIHCYVSGRVQSVWFRASTQKKALSLNITGWVKNLADGRVELMACGEPQQLMLFEQWLRQGPPQARVDNVEIKSIRSQSFTQFDLIM